MGKFKGSRREEQERREEKQKERKREREKERKRQLVPTLQPKVQVSTHTKLCDQIIRNIRLKGVGEAQATWNGVISELGQDLALVGHKSTGICAGLGLHDPLVHRLEREQLPGVPLHARRHNAKSTATHVTHDLKVIEVDRASFLKPT